MQFTNHLKNYEIYEFMSIKNEQINVDEISCETNKEEEIFIKKIGYDGYIYLLQEREFTKTKEDIFKIGRTSEDIFSGMDRYPKSSKVIFFSPSTNCKKDEKELIKIFSDKFRKATEFGKEYFEGECFLMIEEIIDYFKKTMNNCVDKKQN